MKPICELKSIGVFWAIKVLEVLYNKSLPDSKVDLEHSLVDVDKVINFLAICCLSSKLCNTLQELIDWVKLM